MAEEIAAQYWAEMVRGAEMGRAQVGSSDAGRRGAGDAVRPGVEEEAGRGNAEDTARPDAERKGRTRKAASERSTCQVEEKTPVPNLTEVGGEEAATTAAEQMVPAEETLEMAALEQFESPGEVASNAVLGEASTSIRIAAASEGGLGANCPSSPARG